MLPFIRSDLAQLTAYTPHPEMPQEAASRPGATPLVLDRLDTNENPYDLPEELKQKLAWLYQREIETNRYPDGGHETLKQAIADYVNESASLSSISAGQISVGNGSDELIRSLLIATCLQGQGSILVANPTFSMYGILAQTLGIPVVTVGRSEVNFELDLTAAQAAIEQPQDVPVRVVFVVHPNSPTANALTAREIAWLRTLPDHVLVVVDEAYFEFSQTTLVQELSQRPNWVILRTFSKAFRLAAHRIGYAIAHPELAAALEKVRLPYNLPTLTQVAAQIALNHRQELLSVVPTLRTERDRLLAALTQLPQLQVWPSAANFLYLRVKESAIPFGARSAITTAHLSQTLKAEGTLIRHTGGGLRVTVGTADENQRTLQRLQAALVSQAASR